MKLCASCGLNFLSGTEPRDVRLACGDTIGAAHDGSCTGLLLLSHWGVVFGFNPVERDLLRWQMRQLRARARGQVFNEPMPGDGWTRVLAASAALSGVA